MYIMIGSDIFGNFKIKDHTEVKLGTDVTTFGDKVVLLLNVSNKRNP